VIVIAQYLDSLASALSFDRALAQAVRDEVEDHLREAIAADRGVAGVQAEGRALARFGEPYALAAEIAVLSLAKQTQKTSVFTLLALLAALLAMKFRVAWYAHMEWTISEEWKPLGTLVLSIDRYAFWISVFFAAVFWASITAGWFASGNCMDFLKRVQIFLILAMTSLCALLVSVAGDATLTILQLLPLEWSMSVLVPVALTSAEIVCACALVMYFLAVAANIRPVRALADRRQRLDQT
jgi:hypothetical protein